MTPRTRPLLTSLLLVGCRHAPKPPASTTPALQPPEPTLDQQAEAIWQLLSGEFSNHEQVLGQTYRGEDPYRELHHILVPFEMERLGDRVLFVQQTMAGQDTPYRTRLYSLVPDEERQQVRLDIFKLENEAEWISSYTEPEHLAQLAAEAQIVPTPGCSVFWTPEGEGFTGETDEGTCRVESDRLGKTLVIQDNLTLNQEVLTIQDVARDTEGALVFGHPEGEPHINRRLRYYSGWSVVREGGPDYDRENPVWRLHKGLQLHSEGAETSLIDENGEAIPYRVELARLTRSASSTHLLKLTLIDAETDKPVAYTWTDPDASRIGLNIGWAQVGLTLESVEPAYAHNREEESELVRTLESYLTGVLSSSAQSEADENFRAIRLTSCRIQAPGIGPTVLYVEQAVESDLDKPYRQRLYRIEENESGGVSSFIYTLNTPESWIGACNSKALRSLHASDASLKEGCEVEMSFEEGVFRGATAPESCPSSLRGASYATAEVTVSPEGIDSLDRGYDAQGNQVWGSESGAYQFRTQSPDSAF